MLAASRVANTVRVAMPYAQWVAYLVQLGYVGYKSYQMYQDYRAQMERDARNSCNRTHGETIELVIKPRKRRDANATERTAVAPDLDSIENQENQLQNAADSSEDSTYQSCNIYDQVVQKKSEQNHGHAALEPFEIERPSPSGNHNDDEDDVTIVYDSTASTSIQGPKEDQLQRLKEEPTTSTNGQPVKNNCDTESDTSTSLDSTDSNRGIISDVYTECFICARSLEDPRKPVATLPFCMHPFHQSCLDGVLKWHLRCPVCDFHIFSPI